MRISDWSSDVCSSDLVEPGGIEPERLDLMIAGECEDIRRRCGRRLRRGFVHSHGCGSNAKSCDCTASGKLVDRHTSLPSDDHYKIGRASCRERVCQYV